MNDKEIEILAQQRLLQWAAFAGDKGKTFLPPEQHGEDILSALRAVTASQWKGTQTGSHAWFKFLRLVFQHEVQSSPWGLVLLHAVLGRGQISDGVYLSPLPKFLYPRECAVLGCNNPLSSAFNKDDILNDKDGQIKCNACKGKNKSWNKLVIKLKPALALEKSS